MAGDVVQMVECLLGIIGTLDLISSTAKIKNEKPSK
jgi:hypothetical protein